MRRQIWLAVGVTTALFVLDRLSRDLAFVTSARTLIPHILWSEPVLNAGVAFGFRLPPFIITILFVILILVVGWLAARALRHSDVLTWWATLIVFAGATSNVIDRLRFGAVRDFLKFSFRPTTGNLGDWMITLGAIILLATTFRKTSLLSS